MVEFDELGRCWLWDLVVMNLDRMWLWILVVRVDFNILMRELEVFLRGLEKVIFIVFYIYLERYYYDRVELVIWNRFFMKVCEFGLSDKFVEDFKKLFKYILSVQKCIWLMVIMLGKFLEEIELLMNVFILMICRLVFRWIVDEVVGVYVNIF